MDAIEALTTRRSCRSFKQEQSKIKVDVEKEYKRLKKQTVKKEQH